VNRAEVFDLLIEIKQNYPNFDVSDESIERHYKYLRDFPFEAALKNVEQHIMTERFPPTIADIRGRLGEQMDSQRSKDKAVAYFEQLERWRKDGSEPPPGYWDSVRAKLKGDAG
jgi:hypothetical protein